ncbi:hypothetical protein [Desulfovibrio sp.]|uniref:hypothetical protein n=1 Tax=Desulfovibrio sp. TaxID=885 RepID=UPI0035B1CF9A
MDYEDVIEAAVIKYYDSHDFEAIFDGCESSLSECPECLRETFIAEEGLCPVCEYELKYKNCKACKIPLSVDEQQYNGFCEQCFILDPADFEEDAH